MSGRGITLRFTFLSNTLLSLCSDSFLALDIYSAAVTPDLLCPYTVT